MFSIVMCGKQGAELFTYDTTSGEQALLVECPMMKRLAPLLLSRFQRGTRAQFSNDVAFACRQHFDEDVPIILALIKSSHYNRDYIAEMVMAIRGKGCHVSEQCFVDCDGQRGVNQVIRERLPPHAIGRVK